MATEDDRGFLARAVELSRGNLGGGDGGPFGAVVVRDGKVLGEGANRVLATHDPSAHAEIVALRAACAAARDAHLPGATLYTSCEPCPMCLAAAYWARISRIVYAATRDDAAAAGFIDAELYELLGNRSPQTLPRERIALTEAAEVLRAWQAAPDRRLY